tara:strand:+ start:66 stop:287 length:222 start_codon:yes stop_codon:yes gene_type:complete
MVTNSNMKRKTNDMTWIKIDNENLPTQGEWVICSDGTDWTKCYVTYQFEFAEEKDSKLVYSGITHFAKIELPK